MATITSNQSGNWGDTSTWIGGVLPGDGDAVVISAGHSVKMNVDLSAVSGLFNVTIQGSDGTPGTLYWMDGTSGYLKLRSGYYILGTSGTNKGRILINSDGVWANSGPLGQAYYARLLFGQIDCAYLDIRAFCSEPTIKKARVCGTTYTVTASGSTFTGATLANDTIVSFSSTGSLPTPLKEGGFYKVSSTSGNTFKLKQNPTLSSTSTPEITLTDTGSGTITVYIPITTAVTTLTVLDADLTTDSHWTTAAESNVVIVSTSHGHSNNNRIMTTLTAVGATSVTVAATYNSIECPANIALISRNVSFRQHQSSSHAFANILNATVIAEARGVAPSTGALLNSVSGGVCYYNAINCRIGGTINCYNTAISLGGDTQELSCIYAYVSYALATIGPPYPVITNTPVVTGDLFGVTTGFRLLSGIDFSGTPHGVYILFSGSFGLDISGTYKEISSLFNGCQKCSFNGIIYNSSSLVSTGYNIDIDAEIYNCAAVTTGANSGVFVSGSIELMHTINAASNLNEGLNVYSCEIDDATTVYHSSSGICLIKNCDIQFPLRFTNINLWVNGAAKISIYLENVNSSSEYDGLYAYNGKVLRVYPSQYAYVPSTSYDGVNDFLMATDLTSEVTKIHGIDIIKNQRVWCESGARTLRVYLVSSFTTLSLNDLVLTVRFAKATTGFDIVTDSIVPNTSTNWSQYLEVEFTLGQSGFVTVDLQLFKYESGARLFVYPWPVVS
jgi:hypothetical protein